MIVPNSCSMMSWLRSSWVSRLPAGRRGSDGAGNATQRVVVEEVGHRPVPDVMEQPRDAEGLHDEPFRRDGRARQVDGELGAQRRVEVPGPDARLVHHPEPVGEARVLGRREDPPGALELRDPAETLEPRRIEDVLLGDRLRGQAGRGRLGRRDALGQLDVAVDRVADQVDRGERMPAHTPNCTRPNRISDPRPPSGDGDVLRRAPARDIAGPVARPDGQVVGVAARP